MKVLYVVLIAVVLLVSCTTVEEIKSPKGLEIDEVEGSEVTQEEFEELFGKKDFYSYPDTIIKVNTIDPVSMGDSDIKDLAIDV